MNLYENCLNICMMPTRYIGVNARVIEPLRDQVL